MKEGGRDVGALTCDWIQLYIPQHALYSSERLLVDGTISLHISIQPESLGHIKSTLLIPQPFQLNLLISPSPSPTPSILPRRVFIRIVFIQFSDAAAANFAWQGSTFG